MIMFKWLTILIIVLLGFLIVLLSLGYLLHENEQVTHKYQQQLQQKQSNQSTKSSDTTTEVLLTIDTLASDIKDILVANMTCQSDSQCKLISLQQGDNLCLFATNTIGASKLKKLVLNSGKLPECYDSDEISEVSCQNNICVKGNNQ